jgi:hypothetical protein
MKTTVTLFRPDRVFHLLCSLLFFLLAGFPTGYSQTPVTALFTHRVNATSSSTYVGTGATGNSSSGLSGNSYTYMYGVEVATPNILILDSFTAAGLNYHLQAATPLVVRRVDNAWVTGLRKDLWFEQNSNSTINTGGTAKLIPSYYDSLEQLFSSGQILNIGMDNNFQNDSITDNGNIERMDFMVSSGFSAADVTKAGFVVFDRGQGTSHDPFYIAAIKTLDGSGNPASYYNAIPIAAANYGDAVGPQLNYLVLRENQTDAHLLLMNNTAAQHVDGVLVTLSQLGVANNATIFGYSIVAPDVAVSPATNLVNYTNAANFPITSDLPSGGLDQVAISGVWITNTTLTILSDMVLNLSSAWANGKIQLGWTLLSQADKLAALVIERSSDGRDFLPLLYYPDPATGTQTAVDPQPLPGNNYYRLKLVNQDSSVAGYSSITVAMMPSISGALHIKIFPDPLENKSLTLEGESLRNQLYCLSLIDRSGHLLYSEPFTGSNAFTRTFQLPPGIPAGIYLVRLTERNGTTVFSQLIMSP